MLMREERKRRFRVAILVLLISGIVGNLLGIFLGALLPQGSVNDVLARSVDIGLDPPLSIDLWIVSLSLGFQLRLNLCSFLFMFFGLMLYKKA